MRQLTLSIVTYNSAPDLPAFFNSLRQQTYQDFTVTVVDNASTDETVAGLQTVYPEAHLIRNNRNRGYGAAHNQGIAASDSEFILIANVDMVLDPGVIETLLDEAEHHQRGAAFGVKMLKIGVLNNPPEHGIIDSAGLQMFRNRRCVDRGEGETDRGQYDQPEEVFGITGAMVLLRRVALIDAALPDGQCFDESFFMYQEDIDLAWRLRGRGWTALYQPRASVWHRRSAYGRPHAGTLETARARKKKSTLINRLSYRNHLMTLRKNETRADWRRDWPRIVWYEFRKAVYLLFFEPATLRGWLELFQQWKRITLQRTQVQARRTASIRQWIH